MNTIKEFFKNQLQGFKNKTKSFFNKDNLKRHAIGFIIALTLLITVIVLAYNLDYQTAHKKLYTAKYYVTFILITYILYLIKLFLSNKKSATDLIIVVYVFFIIWDVSYKVGWVHNDLLILLNKIYQKLNN